MRYYPLFFDLEDAACLIVGAGQVGRRKAATLLLYPLRELRIVDPASPTWPAWPEDSRIVLIQREFEPGDLDGMSLVFAATNSARTNDEIARLCADRNILCNNATGGAGSFIVPASMQSGPIQIAVSTQGASPALSSLLKRELAAWLDNGYADFAVLLAELRPLILGLGLSQAENAGLFNLLCEKTSFAALLEPLRSQNAQSLEQALKVLLPPQCWPHLPVLSVKVISNLAQNIA